MSAGDLVRSLGVVLVAKTRNRSIFITTVVEILRKCACHFQSDEKTLIFVLILGIMQVLSVLLHVRFLLISAVNEHKANVSLAIHKISVLSEPT